ncbi:MAG TPA: FtsW/RodA/SpoVE family cell cycle protein [Paenibacillaceae bacterium]
MLNRLKKMDALMLAILVLFMGISYLAVRSAVWGTPLQSYPTKTLLFYAAGFLIIPVVTLINYRWVLKWWYLWYGAGIALLVAVYFFAPPKNNARSWFELPGGYLFQPAELMKVCLILAIAAILGRRMGNPLSFRQDVLPVAAAAFLPFLLVMIQPDLGNAIIYIFIVLGMLWIGNVRYTHVLIGLTAFAVSVAIFVNLFNTYNEEIRDFLVQQGKSHWYERINTFINPDQASADEKFQSQRAQIAIGSGGLAGDGYMQGNSIRRELVPYLYSDSIFVVIGEEFGFQGAAVLLLLYFVFIYRMIMIAFQCNDLRGSYIIIGVASMWVFQIFQNIGMMIGIMPITGITLPFISYGGTSLLINMLSVGFIMSVRAHQEQEKEEEA